jgi:2',3'-cyclic-nucleotide 2'-phosphodiesterase (5'-nucleotidase family)
MKGQSLLHSFFVRLLLAALLLVLAYNADAQVRISLWSDSHSTVETLSRQVLAIDQAGQEFLQDNPSGEFIIFVNADHTSVRPGEDGWISIEALVELRRRGHTVIFVIGNHDALDFVNPTEGAGLLLEQLQYLYDNEVMIMSDNLRGLGPQLAPIMTASYSLQTLENRTELVGLTIPQLIARSSLTQEVADSLFERVESFQETWDRLIPEMSNRGVESMIFGIHSGHHSLSKQVEHLQRTAMNHGIEMNFPLLMAAHDHIAAAYSSHNTTILDAGSHGSFSFIDVDRSGEVLRQSVHHISISEESLQKVNSDIFRVGQLQLNGMTELDIYNTPWLVPFHERVRSHMNDIEERFGHSLVTLEYGIPEHKMDMKASPALLGMMLVEVLTRWTRDSIPADAQYPIIGMQNSTAYRLHHSLPPGEVTEYTIRDMYPFPQDAAIFLLNGATVWELYFSLRLHYQDNGNPESYTPQLGFDARENNGHLEIRDIDGLWTPIEDEGLYWVPLDAWLAAHTFGGSYQVPEWLQALEPVEPLLKARGGDILVEYLPQVFADFEHLYLTDDNPRDQILQSELEALRDQFSQGRLGSASGGLICTQLFSL